MDMKTAVLKSITILHSEAETLNWRNNKKKTHFWLKGDFHLKTKEKKEKKSELITVVTTINIK